MRIFLIVALSAGAFTSYSQTDSAQQYLQKGLEEKTKGRALEAYKAFDKAYAYNKTDKAVVSELAGSLYELRRYSAAKEKYLALEQMGAPSAETYRRLMDLSVNMRHHNDAIKYGQLAKKTDPAAKTAYFIGKAHYDLENYGEAIKFLNIASSEDDKNAEVPYMIARSYADMMNYKQAMPYFEKAMALAPTNTRWMYETGLMYYAMRDDKSSLKYLLLAAEKGYKRDNEYLENLAIAYLNNKQTDKGLEILEESLKRRPSDINLLNMVAEANYEAGRFDAAIAYYDRIFAMDKEDASSLYMIGMSYQKKGDKQKGQAICDRAIQMDPSLAKNKQKMQMPGGM